MWLTRWVKVRRGPTWHLGEDDIVVFVVGPSGSGKSAFVEQATRGSDLIKVGTSLRPRTSRVQAVKYELTDAAKAALGITMQKNIVFVDTPSFHTQPGRQDKAADSVKTLLSKSKSKSTPNLVGTIYMHRVETDPRYESVQKHLNTFASTFPRDFIPLPQRLHAVFSYEGMIPNDTIQLRRETFEAQLRALRPSLGPGLLRWNTSFHPAVFRYGDAETAWEAVVALFSTAG